MSSYSTTSIYKTSDMNQEQCLDIAHFVLDGEDMECCIIEVANSEQTSLDTTQSGTHVFYLQQDEEESEPMMMLQTTSEDDHQSEQILLYQQLPESQPAIVVPQPFIMNPSIENELDNNNGIISTENTDMELLLQSDINENQIIPLTYDDSENIQINDVSYQNSELIEQARGMDFWETHSVDLKEIKVKKARKPRSKLEIIPQLQVKTRRKTLLEQSTQFCCIVDHVKSKERVTRAQNLQQMYNSVTSETSRVSNKASLVKVSKKKQLGKSAGENYQPKSFTSEGADDDMRYEEVDLYTQMSILKEVDKNILSNLEIATKYNIGLAVVCNIISNRIQIEETYKNEYVNMLDLAPKSGLNINKETSSLPVEENESLLLNKCRNISFEIPIELEIIGERTENCNLVNQNLDKLSKNIENEDSTLKTKKKNTSENIETRDVVKRTPSQSVEKSLDLCTKMEIINNVKKGELSNKEIIKKYNISSSNLTKIINEQDKIEQSFNLKYPENHEEKTKERKKRIELPRKSYDLQTKLKIIADIERGNKKKSQIAKKFQVPKATVSTIFNSKEKILASAKNNTTNTCKRLGNTCNTDNNYQRIITYNSDGTLKRTILDLFTKVEILKLLDSKKFSNKAIAEKYNVATPTISCILKQRKNIENFAKMNNISKVKFRTSPHMEIEHRLCDYVRKENTQNGPMTNTQICLQAIKIAHQFGFKNFKCHPSSAWIWRFKKRFNIVTKRTTEEERDRVHKALEDKRKVKANTGSYVCDLCNLELPCASAMEKHLMCQHFPTDI